MALTLSTTSPVTLAEAKAHLRVDGDTDDTYIGRLLVAATQWVESETRVSLAETESGQVPELLKQAILLLVGHLYENREAATDRRIDEVPLGVQRIMWLFAQPEAV